MLYGMATWKTIPDNVTYITKPGGYTAPKPITEGTDGIKRLVNYVSRNGGNGHGSGAVCLFADTDSHGEGRAEELAAFIRKHGYRVDESIKYKNPSHGGKCKVYLWYYQLEPKRTPEEVTYVVGARGRPVSKSGRKAVVKKAKTTRIRSSMF